MSAAVRWVFPRSWAVLSSKFCWLHWQTTRLQKCWTCWSCLLFTPCSNVTDGVAVVLPNRMVEEKSSPRRQWSPLIIAGSPKGSIQAYCSAVARRGLPIIISIGWLPLWCVAGFGCAGNQCWWRSIRSVLSKSFTIWACGSSIFSLASIPISTSLFWDLHSQTCWMRSEMNYFLGLGLGTPCLRRSQVCCAVDVVVVASKGWGHTWYADTMMRHIPCWPTNSRYDQHPRSSSCPHPMTLLAHLPHASVRVPPGWKCPSLLSWLHDVASLKCHWTLWHWV